MYGLYNSSGKELILPLVTDMYVINNSGENQYYLTYQGNTMKGLILLQMILVRVIQKVAIVQMRLLTTIMNYNL